MPVLRLQGHTGPGLIFVTTTVIDWLPVFVRPDIARIVVQQLAETARIKSVSISGYVVMPSHVHMLIGLHNVHNLSRFVQAFKSLTSRRVLRLSLDDPGASLYQTGQFRLWMRRFDDVIITSEEQFRIKLNYIHNNPVRAGLVEDAIGWEYSSARSWLLNESGVVPIDKDYGWMRE